MSVSQSDWIPKGAVYYNQPYTAAVIFDPEGGHHVCYDHTDTSGNYWCAGMVDKSPEALANRLHEAWFRNDPEPEEKYLFQLNCYKEYE